MNFSLPKFLPRKPFRCLVLCVVLFQYTPTYSQVNEGESSYYNWFDTAVGQENSSLYNGILFVDVFNVINDKHRFFDSQDFISGSIHYDGQTYYGQRLKYDLYGDEILVNPIGTSKALIIQLRKSKTEAFSLNDRKFIRVDKSPEKVGSVDLGFCEVLSEKGISSLLKRHTKNMEAKKNEEFEYNEFHGKNSYYLELDRTYFTVNSQREWISAFPQYKKDIKSLYKAYKLMRKTDPDTFHKMLFQRFSDTQSQTDSKR